MVMPYAEAVLLPDHASRKLAMGSSTLVLPPSTTKPVRMMKTMVQILTMPTALENQYAYLVLNTRPAFGQFSKVKKGFSGGHTQGSKSVTRQSSALDLPISAFVPGNGNQIVGHD